MSWHTKPLGEIAEVIRGVTYQKHALLPEGHPDGIALLRATNIQGQFVDYENPVTVPRSMVKDSQMLRPGDVLVASSSGSESVVGKNSMVVDHIAATFGAFCTLVRPSGVNPRFLAHFLGSSQVRQRWRAVAKGSNINNLRSSEIVGTPVPLPPLEEQRRIVAELEDQLGHLDATRTQLTQAETQLEQLRASTLNNYFGSGTQRVSWDMIPLGSLVLEQRKLVTPEPEVEYEVWAVTAYANGSPDVSYGREIKSSKQIVEPGDVLISKINPRINRVWQVTESHLPQIASTEWLSCRVRDATQVDTDYLVRFLQSPVFRNWIAASSSSVTGSHSRAKSREILKQMVPVPPLDEQRRIVAELEDQLGRLNATSTQLAQTENQFEQLRASVLHRAFSGGRDD